MTAFAARLLHARSEAGFTQRELSEMTGISTVQLSRYESGKSIPRPRVLSKLAKCLHVSKEWLETGEANTEARPTLTIASTKQGVDSYEITFAVDRDTAKLIESSAKDEGITPGAYLKRLVFQQIEQNVRNHPTLTKEQIEQIAAEVKALLASEKP